MRVTYFENETNGDTVQTRATETGMEMTVTSGESPDNPVTIIIPTDEVYHFCGDLLHIQAELLGKKNGKKTI